MYNWKPIPHEEIEKAINILTDAMQENEIEFEVGICAMNHMVEQAKEQLGLNVKSTREDA